MWKTEHEQKPLFKAACLLATLTFFASIPVTILHGRRWHASESATKYVDHGNYIRMATLSPVWYVSMCVSQSYLCNQSGAYSCLFVSSLSAYENHYLSVSFGQPIKRVS